MDKVMTILRRAVLMVATALCVVYTYRNIFIPDVELINDIRVYDYYVDTYYQPISENSGITSLNGLSNAKVNLLNQGFEVYSEEITDNGIDLILMNSDGEVYRYYFDMKTNRVTFFYSDYERSSLGESYIIEEKGKE